MCVREGVFDDARTRHQRTCGTELLKAEAIEDDMNMGIMTESVK